MLEYNEIKPRKVIVFDGQPCEVIDSHVFRKQQRKPVNATKLKNLITGKLIEYSFHQSEKAEEANLETKEAKYLYTNRGEFWFCDPKNPSNRFQISTDTLGDKVKFVKINSVISLLYFGELIIGIDLPIKVELKVTEAPPAVRGNTVQGGTKQVTLETGATINCPMFVNEGDTIRVNTETGDYVERI